MYYNFQTNEGEKAVAALLIYAIYRSRDKSKFKITPDMWGIIERSVKSVAKRAMDLEEFIEKLKPKLKCSTIIPKWAKTIPDGMVTMKKQEDGSYVEVADMGKREFLVDVLTEVNHREVLDVLYEKAALAVLLVRDRIEREKEYINIEEGEDNE
jgi:hypothetical protein